MSKTSLAVVVLLTLGVTFAAQATSFVWTGGVNSTWAQSASPFNWSGGSGANVYPGSVNAYGDTATISLSTNNPVTLNTTVTLGGAATALTIGNYTPANATALDIAAAGTLEMQGGISLGSGTTNPKKMTIEGILRNDGTAGTHYAINGGSASNITQLVGGTISSLNGGIWDFNRPVQGYGLISAPFTNTANGTITANVSGQTLSITGNGTITGTLTSTTGAFLELKSAISGGTIGSGASMGEMDLNGATLSGVTYNASTGTVKLTGDSTISGTFTRNNVTAIDLNGHTLNLSGATISGVTGNNLFTVGTGTLNNSAATATSTGNDGTISLGGGSITNTGGGSFTIGTQILGYGSITGPITVSGSGSARASGGTLSVTNMTVSGVTILTNGAAGDVLDLHGTINFGTGGFLYSNPSGNAGNGVIQLNGATLQGTINSNLLGQGTVNVVDNSAVSGTYYSSATLGINSGKQLSIAGGTLNVNVGSIANSGTLAIGNGTLKNLTANAYSLGGGGSITLAGGSIASSGGGGFTSSNALSGYGTVSATYTNNAKVTADGGGSDANVLTLQSVAPVTNTGGMGWYARNHGKLALPAIVVGADGAYNWGGSQMVNSIAMNISGVTASGNLAVSLLSSDRADAPAGLINPIGVWAFNPGTLAFGSAGMTFRYDDALAASVGDSESALKLYGYDGAKWNLIPTSPADTTSKTLATAAGLSSFYQDFAIAAPLTLTPALTASPLSGATVDFGKLHPITGTAGPVTQSGAVTLSNTGDAGSTLGISAAVTGTNAGLFHVSNPALPKVLTGGAAATPFSLLFDGGAPGIYSATVTLNADNGQSASCPVTATVLYQGDANEDGKVSFADYIALANNFGQSSATWQMGDFNGDGTVSFADYILLANNFGQHVPEPATLGLLLLGGMGLIRRKK